MPISPRRRRVRASVKRSITLAIDENRAGVGPKQSKNELEHADFPAPLKLILGLLRPDAGAILVNGQRIDRLTEADLLRIRGDIGMLFQENALFDSLTVAENVGLPIVRGNGHA